MENAGLRTLELIEEQFGRLNDLNVVVLAGKGNNGGDGLVVARHLINAGARVNIFLMVEPDKLSGDARANYLILNKMNASIYPLCSEADLDRLLINLLPAQIIIDAIYGIGFKGSLNDLESRVAKMANWSQAMTIAVDIPSGVEADTGKVNGEAIKADHTITFALPKIGLVLEPGRDHVGTLTVADISIPAVLLQSEVIKTSLITEAMVKSLFKPRAAESHKGTYGHALVIGGSMGMAGALMMTSYAALKTGSGLVTAGVPSSLVPIVQSSLLEVMCQALASTPQGTISLEALPVINNLLGSTSVCAIGPGMSRYDEAYKILCFVLENAGIPVLIDADGLNALQGNAEILKDRQIPVVITPHPGEMARLTGLKIEEIQENRLEIARQFAQEWGITIVLKGNRTVVACPSGDLFVNITGNPGMATAGSGDVLSGIILGLMAQGMKAHQAALAGVYIHGRAGDRAAESTGQRGLVATDMINCLPEVLRQLES
jgi:NAD(P)H-hydrate epimerase